VAEPLTRDRIVEATRRMIETGGLEAVSLRRVGSALGVTAPALYAYVTDKNDLLRTVAEGEFDRLMERFADIDDPDPVERVRKLSRAYVDHAIANPELFRTMFLFPPELANTTTTGQELPAATKAFEMALSTTTAAVDQGCFPGIDPLTAALTTWTAIHGLADILLLGFGFDEKTRDQLIDTVIDTMVHGLQAG
jgi:AcrR family transcriptional regulator